MTATRDRGSVLLLMPTAVLIVVLLSSMAIDRAVVLGAQRDLVAIAQTAADDAAAAGVDLDALRSGAGIAYDRARIDRAVRIAAADEPDVEASWTLDGSTITVRLRRTVSLVFAPAIRGADRRRTVTARASAVLNVR